MGVEESADTSRGRTAIALGIGLVAGLASLLLPSPTGKSDQDTGTKAEAGNTATESPVSICTRHDSIYVAAEIRAIKDKDYNNTPPAPKPKKDYTPSEAILPHPLRIAEYYDSRILYARQPPRNINAGNGNRETMHHRKMNMA